MTTIAIKPSAIYNIKYNRKCVSLATQLSTNREYLAIYWRVAEGEVNQFIVRSRYVKKHGLLATINAGVDKGKAPKQLLYYFTRLQRELPNL